MSSAAEATAYQFATLVSSRAEATAGESGEAARGSSSPERVIKPDFEGGRLRFPEARDLSEVCLAEGRGDQAASESTEPGKRGHSLMRRYAFF